MRKGIGKGARQTAPSISTLKGTRPQGEETTRRLEEGRVGGGVRKKEDSGGMEKRRKNKNRKLKKQTSKRSYEKGER